jgi:hypothetical protein
MNKINKIEVSNYNYGEENLTAPMYPIKQKPIIQQKQEPIVEDSEIKEINYRKIGGTWKWLKPRYLIKRIKLRFLPHISYLINMELNNGMHTTFIVQEKEGLFKFRGKKYVFDDSLKYYHLPSGLFAFNYHEGFAMPIIAKIDLNEVQKITADSNITEIEYMTNPAVLERFTVSKIAEGIMKGQQLDAFFRQIRLIVIITLLLVILDVLLFVFKTGMLKNVKIPGLN